MNKKPIVIWGAGGHAKAVTQVLRFYPEYELVGYLDDVNTERRGRIFEGKEIYGGIDRLDFLKENGIRDVILGFGHCRRRIENGHFLKESGFNLPSMVHPTAAVASNARIGEGVVILSGAIIDAGCAIGDFTIVNNGANISHESVIGEGSHISPGVNIAGKVVVGRGCWLGIGATIINDLIIGDYTIIGAGSVVVEHIPSGMLAYGNPAKIIRNIEAPF